MNEPPLASVAHELRTPLSALLGYLSLLDHPRYQERHDELLGHARRSAELMAVMLANVALSDSLASLEVVFEPFSLGELLAEVRGLLGPLVEGRGLEFTVADGEGLTVHGERTLIRQVLCNLITNAAHNTEGGSVAVEACREGDQVLVAVRDTGRGLTAGELELAVLRYARLEGHRQGLGLGLFVCSGVLERHCSRLDLASTPGEGTTASFRLE